MVVVDEALRLFWNVRGQGNQYLACLIALGLKLARVSGFLSSFLWPSALALLWVRSLSGSLVLPCCKERRRLVACSGLPVTLSLLSAWPRYVALAAPLLLACRVYWGSHACLWSPALSRHLGTRGCEWEKPRTLALA